MEGLTLLTLVIDSHGDLSSLQSSSAMKQLGDLFVPTLKRNRPIQNYNIRFKVS